MRGELSEFERRQIRHSVDVQAFWSLGKGSVLEKVLARIERSEISLEQLKSALKANSQSCVLSLLQPEPNTEGVFKLSNGATVGIISLPYDVCRSSRDTEVVAEIASSADYEHASAEDLTALFNETPFIFDARSEPLYAVTSTKGWSGVQVAVAFHGYKPWTNDFIANGDEGLEDSFAPGILVKLKKPWCGRNWSNEAEHLLLDKDSRKKRVKKAALSKLSPAERTALDLSDSQEE